MTRWMPTIGLFLFCALLFFPGLGARDLTSSHEARAAQNAQMILDEGHWLVPRLFDQHLELQKPPLFYWLVALIGWFKGGTIDAWAVRLPAALSACATVLFLYYLGVRTQRPCAGFLAALILATCLHFTWLARVGRIDMPLTMAITFALGAFHLGRAEDSTRTRRFLWRAFGYTALGVGLLLKGPIAVVLPAVVSSAAWLWRDRRLRLGTSLWWGIPLTLALAAPWYVWANGRTNNQLWEVFFWYHNVERGLGGSGTLASHPWWFYAPRALLDLLPWSLVAPVAVYGFFHSKEARRDDAVCLGLTWFVAILLFLSFMRFKRADYLLPAYPGMAIFLGACIERWWRSSEPEALAKSLILRAGLFAVLLVYVGGWLTYNTWFAPDRDQPYRVMAAEIRGQTRGPVVFFRAESHVLAFHVGHPVTTILEWENLEIWANRPAPVYFVMPESCAREWREHLPADALEEVLHSADYAIGKRDRPLVVLRNQRSPFSARMAPSER